MGTRAVFVKQKFVREKENFAVMMLILNGNGEIPKWPLK